MYRCYSPATTFSKLLVITTLLLSLAACKKGGGSSGGGGNNGGGGGGNTTPVWDPNALRGVWVTNVASTVLDSRDNIKTCVQNCKLAGINNIFMVVYNNARTTYPSTVMQNLIGIRIQEKFSGRDPLREMLDEAHAAGLKVHAWFEYGFSSSYSASGGPIIAAKPNWASKDAGGNLTVKNGFDWLNAFHPEVQQYMIDLFKEVVTNYDVDGVQGDDRLPALPSTAGYDTYTVNLYKSEHGGIDPPGDFREANWINWRTKKLNAFMKRLRNEIKTLKPNVAVTMSPSPFPWGRDEYLQDWPTWVDSSWVDAVIPQCYRYDIGAYNATLTQQKSYHRNTNIPLYPGVLLRVGTYVATDGFLTQMIQSNRTNGFKGEVFFFYEGIPQRNAWYTGQYPYIK
jgi:uncharacterized lipoprotein YddW (UPF0748 family)